MKTGDEETGLQETVTESTSADLPDDTIKEGDFVLLNYAVWDVDDNRLLDTNIEEIAKQSNRFREDIEYKPELVVIGKGFLLKSVEEEIKGMKEGEEKTILLPPEKAFGRKDPAKIKIVSATELTRRGIKLAVNEEIEYGGRRAIIKRIGSGRVVLDFNHPLAGKTLKYYVKIVKKLNTRKEKVKALIERWFKTGENIGIKINRKVVITLPDTVLGYRNLGLIIRQIQYDIQRYLPEKFTAVEFRLTLPLEHKEKKKEEKAKEEKPQPK